MIIILDHTTLSFTLTIIRTDLVSITLNILFLLATHTQYAAVHIIKYYGNVK